MVTSKPLYCLPIVRQGDRFKADRQSTLAFSDLLEYSDLKEFLADGYQTKNAVVEIGGVAYVTRVFEPESGNDWSYALVDSAGSPPALPSLVELLGETIRTYFSSLRSRLSFSDSFPPSHRSYLLTEFIEPKCTVLEGWNDPLRTLTWRDARGLSRAVILGEPGIGKTTFLRRWALEESKKLGTERDSRFPIYVQLRDLTDTSTLLESMLKIIRELSPEAKTESVLKSGRVVLLLDALDEVQPRQRVEVIEQIATICAHWPMVGCLLTSRNSTAPPNLPGFARIQIDQFDRARQDEWIRRRVRRAGRSADRDLLTLFRSSKSMTALAGNPLLLSIAAAFVERTGSVPSRQGVLLNRYIEGLLEDWDEAKGVVRWGTIRLSKQKKLEILCRAAFHTCHSNRLLFDRDDFLAWEKDWSDLEISKGALSVLWEHSAIIQPTSEAESVWRFTHSVIADVLAARYLVERPDNLLTSATGDIEPQRLRHIWRHACDLTQDATPLMEFMLANETIPRIERAELIAQTILDDVTVARVVLRRCSKFVAAVVASCDVKLTLNRPGPDNHPWRIEGRWVADPDSKLRELKLISSLLRTLVSGVSVTNREALAESLRVDGGTIGEIIADQTKTGGSVEEFVDMQSGRVELEQEQSET